MSDKLVMVFTRNPELGKVKTRLAKTIGEHAALNIYKYLLKHTESVLKTIDSDKAVYYTNSVNKNDLWNSLLYKKRIQHGDDLGSKMSTAFQDAFNDNYNKVIIVGSDLPDLKKHHIDEAFEKLDHHDIVIGPAYDGGYYLLGLKEKNDLIFINKDWGTDSVFSDTLNDLKGKNVFLLETLNDVDTYDDIKNNLILKELI